MRLICLTLHATVLHIFVYYRDIALFEATFGTYLAML